jgi:magnesium transporter
LEARLITSDGTRPLPVSEIRMTLSDGDGIVWFDLNHNEEDGMALIPELVDAKPGDLPECHTRSPVPKMHFYADHHFSASTAWLAAEITGSTSSP